MLVKQLNFISSHDILLLHSSDNGLDYSLLDPLSLPFEDCQLRSCIDIRILNDYILEDLVELFTVSLETVPDLNHRITLNPQTSRVIIIDDDGNLTHALDLICLM